jgi:hypothetical protein
MYKKIKMKYLIVAIVFLISSNGISAQDYGKFIEQRKYSGYSIEYHDDYDGPKEEEGVYMEDDDGERQFMGPKYTLLTVTVYEYKVVIECKGRYGDAKGVYGKGKRLTGPNWYGYELANEMQLVISKVNARIYSKPEEIDDEEVFMMEEVFMNPID